MGKVPACWGFPATFQQPAAGPPLAVPSHIADGWCGLTVLRPAYPPRAFRSCPCDAPRVKPARVCTSLLRHARCPIVYPKLSHHPFAPLDVARAFESISSAALIASSFPPLPLRSSHRVCSRPSFCLPAATSAGQPLAWGAVPHALDRRVPGRAGRAGRPQARAPAGAGWQGVGGRGQVGLLKSGFIFPILEGGGRLATGQLYPLVRPERPMVSLGVRSVAILRGVKGKSRWRCELCKCKLSQPTP
jgi:hypothetical protein